MSEQPLSAHDLALVEAVAERVLELLGDRVAPPASSAPRLVDAAELAEVLGVSRDYVYRNAEELGAVRLGGETERSPGKEQRGGSRLRFDVEKAIAAQSARQASKESQPSDPPSAGRSPRRRQRAPGSEVKLLPIGGRKTP